MRDKDKVKYRCLYRTDVIEPQISDTFSIALLMFCQVVWRNFLSSPIIKIKYKNYLYLGDNNDNTNAILCQYFLSAPQLYSVLERVLCTK